MLLPLINLTACQTWHALPMADKVGLAKVIEENRPERVRVFLIESPSDPVELRHPVMNGDELVDPNISVPLSGAMRIEVGRTSIGRTVVFGWLATAAAGLAILGIYCLDSPEDCY